MKFVLPAYQTISAICGKQKCFDGDARLTYHCLQAECPDGTLLYHTLTGELLLLEAGETVETCRDELIKHRFLVPRDFDDAAYADQVKHTYKLLNPVDDTRLNHCLIFTTTDCNARCFYCYEMGIKRQHMSEKTAHDVAAFLINRSKGEKLKILWFGGEPLFNKRVIDIITRDLSAADVPFTSRIISNGYLFDEELVKTAKENWNLLSVQISLDGTEEVYNRSKAYIYREGSAYRRVMRNISLLLDAGIKVSIRLNMDAGNYEDLMRLADELAEKFSGRQNLRAYVALLYEYQGAIHKFVSQEELLQKYTVLYNKLKASGLIEKAYLSPKISLNYCMADADNSVTILPDGRLGKCENETDKEPIGSIYEDKLDTEKIASWKERYREKECLTCPLFPRCNLLKKCKGHSDTCTETERAVKFINLNEQILNTYERENKNETPPDGDGFPETLC